LLSRHQKEERNHDIKKARGYFENVVQFKYFGNTNQNKSKFDLGGN
jgi:hypothetical protein